jgi:hypothetical protein
MLFDGALAPKRGRLTPPVDAYGLGGELKWIDAKEYLVWSST